jgi:hypothetical protein
MKTLSRKANILMLLAAIAVAGFEKPAAGQSRRDSPPRTTTERQSGATDQADRDECTRRFDRFRNRNTITIEPRTVHRASDEELKIGASAVVEGEGNTAPREIDLNFDSTTNRLRYGNSAEVRFIVDGKRTEAGVAYKMGGFSMRQFNEKLRLTLPANRFLEIIGGRKVEMQIGESEFTLRREDLQRLRGFANCVGLRVESEQ